MQGFTCAMRQLPLSLRLVPPACPSCLALHSCSLETPLYEIPSAWPFVEDLYASALLVAVQASRLRPSLACAAATAVAQCAGPPCLPSL